jgi:hypothetical protein
LVLINGLFLHGEAPPFSFSAASLLADLKLYHRGTPNSNFKGELHLLLKKELNRVSAYPQPSVSMTARVIELGGLRELRPKGSLVSPTSITRKGTSSVWIKAMRRLPKKLSPNEKLTIVLSTLALFLSLCMLYFQFFHISEHIRIAKLHFVSLPPGDILRLVVMNLCNRETLLAALEVHIPASRYIFRASHGSHSPPMILEPGELVVLEYVADYLRESCEAESETLTELPLLLRIRLIGAKGIDRKKEYRIGNISVVEGKRVGTDLLKVPIDMP